MTEAEKLAEQELKTHLAAVKLHSDNAKKAAERPKTVAEIENEQWQAVHAPGVAQREAERDAALRTLQEANKTLGNQGMQLANQPEVDPTARAGLKKYLVTKDISTTIAGNYIQAKKGETVELTDSELLGVHLHVSDLKK